MCCSPTMRCRACRGPIWRARSAPTGRTLPVVVVTGYADTTGLGDQLDDAVLLHKPFGINELGIGN